MKSWKCEATRAASLSTLMVALCLKSCNPLCIFSSLVYFFFFFIFLYVFLCIARAAQGSPPISQTRICSSDLHCLTEVQAWVETCIWSLHKDNSIHYVQYNLSWLACHYYAMFTNYFFDCYWIPSMNRNLYMTTPLMSLIVTHLKCEKQNCSHHSRQL